MLPRSNAAAGSDRSIAVSMSVKITCQYVGIVGHARQNAKHL